MFGVLGGQPGTPPYDSSLSELTASSDAMQTQVKGSQMEKAVGYVRVSSPGQAKDGESLSTQRKAIKEYCKKNNFSLVQIYADEGISGATTKKRPGLLQLLEDAEAKKFTVLIIHRLSRLGVMPETC
jgi:predicted site-specific integrase-resolvase